MASNSCVERSAAAVSGEKPEEDEAEIAVDRPAARGIFEPKCTDVVLELAATLRRRVDEPRGQSRCMLEQVLHSGRFAVCAQPLGKVRRQRVREIDAARRDEIHHDGGRRDRLRQRREIEDRRLGRSLRIVEGESAKRFAPENATALSDFSDGRRKDPVGNCAEEECACGVHAGGSIAHEHVGSGRE